VTLAAFRRRAGLPPVPFVPALQATLVDPDCARALERIGESPAELLARPGESDRATPGAPTSSEVARRIRAAANRAAGELRGLRGELAELDRGLAVQLKRTAGELEELAERLAKRVDRSHANRDGKRGRHGRRLRNTLRPRGRPQAEVLGSLPFLARHGREWLPDLIEELEPLPVEHLIIHLNGT
jgi:hypothetical protein